MMKLLVLKISIVIVYLFVIGCAANITDDSIYSQYIAEADGTTGQDTNAGFGIKTGHIQNGSITAPKVGFYKNVAIVALEGGDYSNPATAMNDLDAWCDKPFNISPCLLKIMPGIYYVEDEPVQMREYVDIEGSGEYVTKIFGNVDRFDAGVVIGASNAELRFLTVNHSGGGTNAIAIYNHQASPRITHVTASAQQGGSFTFAIFNNDHASSIIQNVRAIAKGGDNTYGIYNNNQSAAFIKDVNSLAYNGKDNKGIQNLRSDVRIEDSTAIGTGGTFSFGIGNAESSSIIRNVVASASGASGYSHAIYNGIKAKVPLKINHSILIGTTSAISISGATTHVGASSLTGNPIIENFNGEIVCVASYDGYHKALNDKCEY